jgi:hypothetical protein
MRVSVVKKTILDDFTVQELLDYIKEIPDECITCHQASSWEGTQGQQSWSTQRMNPDIRKGLTDTSDGPSYFLPGGLQVSIYQVVIETHETEYAS